MRKTLAFFTPSVNIGGIERVLITYAGLFQDIGYNVDYLVCYDKSDLIGEIPNGVSIINLDSKRLRKSIWKLVKYFRCKKPEAIIVANSTTYIVLIAKLLSLRRLKIITSHHNYINNEITAIVDSKYLWKLYNLCDAVVAVSSGIRELLITNGVKKHKVHLIYNPINSCLIREKSHNTLMLPCKQYLLFVGRLSVVKNIDFLIRAFKMLSSDIDVNLMIVGDGPERNRLMRLVEDEKMQDRIIFIGAVSNPYSYMKNASVVVLPSFSEAFPTVLLESLLLGKTIVATPTEGAKEILGNGTYGYISKNMDDEACFAGLLTQAIYNPLDADTLVSYVESRFDPQVAIAHLESLLE